jgi:hypothetical protein
MGLNLSKERLSTNFVLLYREYCLKSWFELADSFKIGVSLLLSNMPGLLEGVCSNLLGVLHRASIRFLKLLELLKLEKFVVLLNNCNDFESFKV